MSTPSAPPPSSPAAAQPPRRRGRRGLLAVAVVLVACAGLLAVFFAVRGPVDDEPRPATRAAGPPGTTYRFPLARGWTQLRGDALARQPGRPLTVVQHRGGKGFLVVRAEGRAPASFARFSRELDREFRRRLPDFERRSTRTLRIKAGPAYFYSYVRREQGTVHSVVLVPAGAGSYVINTVAPGGEDEIARALGRMIVGFDA